MKMPRLYKILMPIAVILGICFVFLPASFLQVGYLLIAIGCIVVLFILMQLFMTHAFQDVPSSSVRELLDRCATESDDRILVHFNPEVSLDKAQERLGNQYSQKNREDQFMHKLF
ncbi:MAG: hypothetical protein JXA73_10805 [Acidobacteria bacterium]|nr:hypothetical protein [Acidobacteriota bacterium]